MDEWKEGGVDGWMEGWMGGFRGGGVEAKCFIIITELSQTQAFTSQWSSIKKNLC